MKKILFSTEFSQHAPEVFSFAAELAYFLKARLVIIHAFTQAEVRAIPKEELEKLVDETSKRLVGFVSAHLPEAYQHLKIDYVVKSGFASKAILETALDENIDLIVMGMTGKTNRIDALLGSTTSEVLKKAGCPVLMIPAKTRYEGIDNIAFTTNFEFRDLGAIQYLESWSKVFDAPIHCLHIIEAKEDELSAITNMNILKNLYKRHKRILFDMKQGVFQEEIEQFAKSKRADVIAMMPDKRSLISRLLEGNEVEGLARRVHIPLLVIKDNTYEVDSSATEWMELVNSIA